MTIRRAAASDIASINKLLGEVLEIHAAIRPDIFISGTKKYTDAQLEKLLADDDTPVFAAFDDAGEMLGYCFCAMKDTVGMNAMHDHRSLYIDDLCVDEKARGLSVGRALCEYAESCARERGCYNLTLNVWEGNDSARGFYDKMGFKVQKTLMEKIL